jgi:hypothetical protein
MTQLNLPEDLYERFEHKARERYGEHGATTALVEAVEQWLANADQEVIKTERTLNNQAYQRLKAELERQYAGQCVIIAHGQFQAAADSFEQLKHVAPTARHRLAIRVGQPIPKRMERLWRVQRH